MRGSLRTNILTELNSAISGVHFSFATIFQSLMSSDFAHIPNLSFPMDVVYNRLSISFSSSTNKQANIGEH